MKTTGLDKLAKIPERRHRRKQLVGSLQDAAARAVVSAIVTFGVGLLLKRMFEKSVSQAAEEGAKSGVEEGLPLADVKNDAVGTQRLP